MIPQLGTADFEIQRLRNIIDLMKQGLEDVVNPIGMIEREMPEGCNINGMVVYLLKDPATYTKIAKDTLAKYEKSILTCNCGCGETDSRSHHSKEKA
jgi:hypothetical protein